MLIRETIQRQAIKELIDKNIIPIPEDTTSAEYMINILNTLKQSDDKMDCNTCRYIDINEEAQRLLKKSGKECIHMCKLFGRKLFHNGHEYKIRPCDECSYTLYEPFRK